MNTDIAQAPWQDLNTKGFVHVKEFLSPIELKYLRDDYAKIRTTESGNANYNVVNASWMAVWGLESKLRSTATAVCEATGLNADMSIGALFFAIERGIDFDWHQDHESYFLFQQHVHCLNFYMPIIKGDVKHSNVSIIPFDRLRACAPEHYSRVETRGAQQFRAGMPTMVTDDETGEEYQLPVDIEELKVTPELAAGDLLLLRGDAVHRTQDTQTERVAASFRRTCSTATIDRSRLMSGCAKKQLMISGNKSVYDSVFQCFADLKVESVTAGQFQDYLREKSVRAMTQRSSGSSAAGS